MMFIVHFTVSMIVNYDCNMLIIQGAISYNCNYSAIIVIAYSAGH